jgi:hypothetical protein
MFGRPLHDQQIALDRCRRRTRRESA